MEIKQLMAVVRGAAARTRGLAAFEDQVAMNRASIPPAQPDLRLRLALEPKLPLLFLPRAQDDFRPRLLPSE
jgi:hypothetical protein